MNKTPLISIIVPIYHVEQYLNRCVESIVNQTYSNLEIILVDDGSPDNCPKMCDDWAKRDSRIKVIHKGNGGLSDARNAGRKIAKGDVISFIDSDDWIDPNFFEVMLNVMQDDESDIVSCGVKWVDEDGDLLRLVSVNEHEMLNTHDSMQELLHDGKLKQHVWNKLYRRNVIENIPFEKGKYHEDVFWSYQVIGRAKKISVIADSFYNYVQRTDSIMGESYSPKRLDALDAMQLRCEYIKTHFPDLFDNSLQNYMGSCLYHLQLALHSHQDKAVIHNITERRSIGKQYDFYNSLSGNHKVWMKCFMIAPIITARIKNLLKVGL